MSAERSSERDPPWWRAEARPVSLALFVLALVLRVAAARMLRPAPAWDGVLYERAARGIARGMGYVTFMFVQRSSDTVPTAFYPVGYPAFVGALYRLFGEELLVLQLGGACVSALSVLFAHRIAWRARPTRAAHLAALFCALLPGSIVFAPAAMTEPLFAALLAAALWLLTRTPGGARRVELILSGIALALATYVRPQALLLAPILPLFACPPPTPLWPRVRSAALVTVCTLVPVLPWTARNCRSLDGCALVSTNGGSNLAIGAVPRGNGRYFALEPRDGCRGVVGEVARDRCWRAVAAEAIRRDPLHWLALGAVKLDHTLSYEAFPVGYLRESGAVALDDAGEQRWRRAITRPWRVFLLLALLALAPFSSRSPLPPPARAALAGALVMLATHVVFFGGDRYHLALIPWLTTLVACSLRDTRSWFERSALATSTRSP